MGMENTQLMKLYMKGNGLRVKKSGKGKIIFKSGSIFEGCFVNDLK